MHGCLGNYEVYQQSSRSYSPEHGVHELRKAAAGIKIIHEDIQGNKEFKEARDALQWAQQIFFVGFGYDPINVARLEPQSWITADKSIRGTAFSMTAEEQKQARRALINEPLRQGEYNIKLEEKKAADFFRELPLD